MVAKTKSKKLNVISESIARKKQNRNRKHKTIKKRRATSRGIVYVKHLPHGFQEKELWEYFGQFGTVTRIRLARSAKTLKPRGYAFIEFRYPEVAEIAADAMNNYVMFKQIVKSFYIPPEQIRHDYFRSQIKRIKVNGKKVLTSRTIQVNEELVKQNNTLMTTDDKKKMKSKVALKISKQKKKLADLGISFDLDAVTKGFLESGPVEKNIDETDDDPFDPEKVDIDSDDSFDDFVYEQEDKDDDEDDENKAEIAIEAAKKALEMNVERKLKKIEKVKKQKKNQRQKKAENKQKQVKTEKSDSQEITKDVVKPVESNSILEKPEVAPKKLNQKNKNKKQNTSVEKPEKPEKPAKAQKKIQEKSVPESIEKPSTKKTKKSKETVIKTVEDVISEAKTKKSEAPETGAKKSKLSKNLKKTAKKPLKSENQLKFAAKKLQESPTDAVKLVSADEVKAKKKKSLKSKK